MKIKRQLKRAVVIAFVLASIMTIIAPAYAATIGVSTFQELKNALGVAAAGDIINIDNVETYFLVNEDITIPTGVTVNCATDVYFYVANSIFLHGSFNNNSVVNISENGSIIIDGSFVNNGTIYNNDNGWIINNGTFVVNGGIINNAYIANYSIVTNDGWIGSSVFLKNDGTFNSNGTIVNSGVLENNGAINSNTFYNDYPGTIENRGALLNTNHFNNDTAEINNYGSLINDGYFYNGDEGVVTSYGGTVSGDGAWVGNPIVEGGNGLEYATVSAMVNKLNGNKNLLIIKITEYFTDGASVSTSYEIMINNNAASIYNVGGYKVYVDTKGNVQIRACYFVD
ncbi:MAG: hypothetical protein FWH55_06470 [Oscillospiraceae bacterium]|nr:hypothetical protein [Oscillospiraceae bacterium]